MQTASYSKYKIIMQHYISSYIYIKDTPSPVPVNYISKHKQGSFESTSVVMYFIWL